MDLSFSYANPFHLFSFLPLNFFFKSSLIFSLDRSFSFVIFSFSDIYVSLGFSVICTQILAPMGGLAQSAKREQLVCESPSRSLGLEREDGDEGKQRKLKQILKHTSEDGKMKS